MKIRLWRTRSDDGAAMADAIRERDAKGADGTLYGSRTELPYLVRAAQNRRVRRELAPGRRARRRARLRRLVTASGSAARVVTIYALEAGAVLALLRGLVLIWVPLAWIAGAAIALGLALILDND